MAMTASRPMYSDMSKVVLGAKSGDHLLESTYDSVLRVLKDPESEIEVVTQCLQDLEQCVTCLGEGHHTLVQIVLNMSWLERDPRLTSVYQSFVLTLVSAHINLLKPCLRSLVRKFVSDDRTVEQSSTDTCSHIHALLRSLSRLVPMTSVVLPSVLEEQFPYLTKPPAQLQGYGENVLTVATYLPGLRLQLLDLVVKNLLKLDVRLSRSDMMSALGVSAPGTEVEDEEDGLFLMDDLKADLTMDDMKVDTKPDLDIKSDLDLKPNLDLKSDLKLKKKGGAEVEVSRRETEERLRQQEERLTTALPLATSLDLGMEMVYKFIKNTCLPNGQLDWPMTKKLYRELLSVFDRFIFPTHDSVHVQFIMFYICSFREELADGFIDYLWKKVINPSTQSVYRQTAACYIGSLLTRAAYIPINTTKDLMDLMGRWVHVYLDQTADQLPRADLAHHGPFYAVCQSLFYVFCFKHNEIMQLRKGHKWATSLKLQRIITSKLNPLRVCVPIVAQTFASATRMHQLAFCDTIIERNNRYTLPVSTATFSLAGSHQLQLEAYFPFDPYLLPRSRPTVTSLYLEFSGSLPDEEEQGDEEDDDFLPDEDDLELHEENSGEQMSQSLGRSPMDFMQYSVSPGFKHT